MGSSVSKGKKQSIKSQKNNTPAALAGLAHKPVNPWKKPEFSMERVEKANLANRHYEPFQPKFIDTIQKEIQWNTKLKSGQLTCQDCNARAKEMESQGKPKEAIVAYGLGVQADPSNVANLEDLANLLRKEEEYPLLIEIGHAIVRRKPGNADALFYLSVDLLTAGGTELAITYLHQAIAFNPSHEQAYEALGVAHLSLGRNAEALQAFQVAAHQRPQRGLCHNNIGAALWGLGRKDEAILAFQHAVKLDPDLIFALRSLGCNLQEMGRNEEAIPVLEKLVEKKPEDGEALISLGTALGAVGRIEEGKEALMKSIRLKITDPVELAKIEEQVKHIK